MKCIGVDLGSRTIAVVVALDGQVVDSRKTATGFAPAAEAAKLLSGLDGDCLLATGYGRHLFAGANPDCGVVTEIKAVAAGIRALFPDVDLVLDIGGQDAKVIQLDAAGKVVRFEMNDRCAAGTGKFMELAAMSLGYTLEEFSREALRAEKEIQLSSMCAVFAESEVISLVGRGENRQNIARGLHRAIVDRAIGMLKRFSPGNGRLGFVGGVARSPCVRQLLAGRLQTEILVPPDPQMVAAYGAALLAAGQ